MLDVRIPSSKSNLARSPLETYPRSYATRTEIGEEFFVETVDTLAALPSYLLDWKQLASQAMLPNPFYEPFFLLPAIQRLHHHNDYQFVFVFRKANSLQKPPQLVGFFPLSRTRVGRYPFAAWKLLTNDLIFRAIPLLSANRPDQTLSAFFKWAQASHLGLLELDRIPAEGPFQQALVRAFSQSATTPHVARQSVCAVLTKAEKGDPALRNGRAVREINRKWRRLEELGTLQFRNFTSIESLSKWQLDFLKLEAAGWKGREGTALAQSEAEKKTFLAVTKQAWERNKFQMFGLFLDDQPIAMKCNLTSGGEGFAWKIAYDERFAKFSPGLLLEDAHKSYFFEQQELTRIDACAAADHPLFRRVWEGSQCMQHLLIPCGTVASEFYCAALPLLHTAKRSAKQTATRIEAFGDRMVEKMPPRMRARIREFQHES